MCVCVCITHIHNTHLHILIKKYVQVNSVKLYTFADGTFQE